MRAPRLDNLVRLYFDDAGQSPVSLSARHREEGAAVGCFVSGAALVAVAQRPWLRRSGWTCALRGSAVGGALLAGVV